MALYHGNILDDHNILIKKKKNINLDDFYKKLENKNIGIEKNLVKTNKRADQKHRNISFKFN